MKLIIVKNPLIPLEGYTALTLWPFILTRLQRLPGRIVHHEQIHAVQQLELLWVGCAACFPLFFVAGLWALPAMPFFLWLYAADYLVRRLAYGNHIEAYRNIALEQEAYLHETDPGYLSRRRPFAWLRYIFRKTYTRPVN